MPQNYTGMTDIEIIEGLKNRNDKVFRIVYAKHINMVRHIVTKLPWPKGVVPSEPKKDVQDVMHQAFVDILKAIDKGMFNILSAKFSTIFFLFALRIWQMEMRRLATVQRHTLKLSIEEGEGITEADFDILIDSSQEYAVLMYYFAQLSEKCQDILEMSWHDIQPEEIAAKFQTTEKTIKSKKYKCKEELTRLIRKNPDNF